MAKVDWSSDRLLIGVSALLIFALPFRPIAQPWAVIGSNVFSALVGTTCYHSIPNPRFALSVAAASAIFGMLVLRFLYPPTAAVA